MGTSDYHQSKKQTYRTLLIHTRKLSRVFICFLIFPPLSFFDCNYDLLLCETLPLAKRAIKKHSTAHIDPKKKIHKNLSTHMHRSPSSLFKERKLESFTWDKESQKGSNENTSNISIAENSPLSHPLYTFKSGFGMLYIKDLGFTADSQMGFRPWHLPLYLALDFNYALFGYDSLLEILSGAYLESEKGTFQWAIGLLIGGAFPSNLTYFISNTYAFYLSSALSIHIDDNIKLMFEFRPGYVGPYSSFAANCMVAFYFL